MSITTIPTRTEILQIADQLATKFAERAAKHDAEGSFPHENYVDLRASGYPLLSVPVEYGGWGAGLYECVLAQERLAMGDGSTALSIGMHVQTVGSAAQGRAWANGLFPIFCQEILMRGALINSCATEPELGSPSHGGKPNTQAFREGDTWVISGHKSFASLAPELDYFIIPATVSGADGDQIARFLVPRSPNIEIVPTWNAMGMRSTGSHDLILREVRVPENYLIALAPVGMPDPNKVMQNAWFVLTFCAVYLGVAAAAQQAALTYARDRIPSGLGRPISTLENIQRRLGECELALQSGRAILYRTAETWDAATPEARATMSRQIIACKLTATNAAIQAVDHAMRAVGGSSMTRDLPLERYYRDVRGGLHHPPSDDNGLVMLGRLSLNNDT
ncbi:MAG: acyl-CoA dehydrogenase family protein [Anaerolineae bacterium]